MLKRHAAPLDMCSGPLIPQILRFAIPLILSNILQLLYNAADLIIVGRYTGNDALAAVGATSSLINLIVNLFIGLSIGANAVIARAIGAGDDERTASAAHTAVLLSAVCGMLIGAFGIGMANTMLGWMGTPANVLPGAALYMRIIAAGFPASLVYNFGAAILRANGDTRRPLYFLTVSGIVNVLLNLFFVIVCHMGVAGVALATIASQYMSAVLVILALRRLSGASRLILRHLTICRRDLWSIAAVGIPAGLQSTCYSISNVLIQSSINSFGAAAMAGNTAASNVEGFVERAMDGISQSMLTFVGQNIGAGNLRRIPRIQRSGLLLSAIVGITLGVTVLVFSKPLLLIYTQADETVLMFGRKSILYLCSTYFLVGWINVYTNTMRAMGHSLGPMLTTVFGVCGLRIGMIYTIFRWYHTPDAIYMTYPISWTITLLALCLLYRRFYRQLLQSAPADGTAKQEN